MREQHDGQMRALGFRRFGGPEVLDMMDLPLPVAGPGEAVMKVVASTVNPTDLLMRSGQQAALMTNLQPPYVAGMEFAGHVHQLGSTVDRLRVGQPAMGIVNPRRPSGGAHAQYTSVPAASLAPLPVSVDLVAASTIPMNGLTAKLAIEALDLAPGATLLVTGGTGAVGGYVIELAKKAGLLIIADGKEVDRDLLLRLGADVVVPRGEAMAQAVRARHPEGVDGALDGALLGDAAAAVVHKGGPFVSLRRSQVLQDKRVRQTYVSVLDHATDTSTLAWLADALVQGALTPRVAVRLPADRGAEAHRLLEQGGVRGRVVLLF
jgi:NADPH:quinone reductase-like Zn-dependent oxidoreductase